MKNLSFVKLGNLVKITGGGTPSRSVQEYWGGDIPWVTVKDFISKRIVTAQEHITAIGLKSSSSNLIPANSILMPTRMALGKIAVNESSVAINQDIKALEILDKKRVLSDYLVSFLSTISDVFIKEGKGATVKGIKLDFLKDIRIPLPPLDDQIRIATILTRAENLITKRKESIKALDELLKSTFLEMFGPANKDFAAWPLTEIKELAAHHKGAMRTGPFGSNLLHGEFTLSGDVAVLGIDNAVQNKFAWDQRRYITMEKYNELSSYRIFPGDVIITIMGTIGRAAVIPDDIPLAINTKHLAAITVDRKKANPVFLAYSIHSSPFIHKQFASKNRGAIMNGLNLGLIKETIIRKPPIELQNQFAAIVEKVESIKSKYTQSLAELENLYGSLSQRAFKGELDVSKVPVDVHSMERT